MLCLWSAKGGAGCTVTSAAVGLLAARYDETLLVDLAGDVAPAMGASAVPDELLSNGMPPDGPLSGESGPGPERTGARLWGVAGWLLAPCPPPDALARFERPLAPGLTLLPWGGPGTWSASPPEEGLLTERVSILARLLADEERRVVVDLGLGPGGVPWLQQPFLDLAQASLLVTRTCYLSLSRAVRRPPADGVVLIEERGRALTRADVSDALKAPVVAAVPCDPAVARSVDSGLLLRRLPRSLQGLEPVVDGPQVAW